MLKYLAATAWGLAVLAKGPVGAMLPLLAITVFLSLKRGWRRAAEFFSPGAVLTLIAIGSSWYLTCLLARNYDFLNLQIGSENFGRFFGRLGSMPPWYYIVPILGNSMPFSLLVLPAVGVAVLRRGRQQEAEPSPEAGEVALGLAIFWIVTVTFFSIAAYKRRAYLLPLWPSAAGLIAWWLMRAGKESWRRISSFAIAIVCGLLIIFNLIFLPNKEILDCRRDSYRAAATEILRVVGPQEPLFSFGMSGELAPLLFYLDRTAPPIAGKLGDAPPGYVILPAEVWAKHRGEALELQPVIEKTSGRHPLVLLHQGKLLARN